MEQSVLFIDKDEWLYREQLLLADFTKIGCPSIRDSMLIGQLTDELRNSIRLVFIRTFDPFTYEILNSKVMPSIPNAGVLFIGDDPKNFIDKLKSTLGGLPSYVYGARSSVTPFEMREVIDIAFDAKHHETAKANLKERWGGYL